MVNEKRVNYFNFCVSQKSAVKLTPTYSATLRVVNDKLELCVKAKVKAFFYASLKHVKTFCLTNTSNASARR